MGGRKGVMLAIAGGSDLGCSRSTEAAVDGAGGAHLEANIHLGTRIDDSWADDGSPSQ